jgi:hypothetical protein
MAPFTWPIQAIAWLPEALRPGVFVALLVLLLWFVFVRRGVPDLWRACCRCAARLLDFGLGIVLRPEYMVTRARRRRGQTPPQWAFALANVTDVVEDGALRLYQRYQPRVMEVAEHDDGTERPSLPRRKRTVPLLCLAIVLLCTAAWVAMDQLPATSIAKYRFAQAFDPWREIEEWAGVDSGRGAQPDLVRARLRHLLMGVRIACAGTERCRGWVLLKTHSEGILAAQYVELAPSSMLVRIRLTHDQLEVARGVHAVVVPI